MKISQTSTDIWPYFFFFRWFVFSFLNFLFLLINEKGRNTRWKLWMLMMIIVWCFSKNKWFLFHCDSHIHLSCYVWSFQKHKTEKWGWCVVYLWPKYYHQQMSSSFITIGQCNGDAHQTAIATARRYILSCCLNLFFILP